MRTAILIIVTAFNLNFAFVSTRANNDIIVYPDDEPVKSEDPCKGLTYCTVKPKDYPEEKFKKMFKNYKALPQPAFIQDIVITDRVADLGEKDNCEVTVTNEPIYQVREKEEDSWRFVVQVPEIDYVQRVRLERCQNRGGKCFNAYAPVPEYVTFCKQKYIAWEILVATEDNKTELIKAQLPICCSCHYKPATFRS